VSRYIVDNRQDDAINCNQEFVNTKEVVPLAKKESTPHLKPKKRREDY